MSALPLLFELRNVDIIYSLSIREGNPYPALEEFSPLSVSEILFTVLANTSIGMPGTEKAAPGRENYMKLAGK